MLVEVLTSGKPVEDDLRGSLEFESSHDLSTGREFVIEEVRSKVSYSGSGLGRRVRSLDPP